MLVLGRIISRAIGSGVGTDGSHDVVWIEGPDPAQGASALMSLTCDIPFNVCCLALNELNKLVTSSLSDHLFFHSFRVGSHASQQVGNVSRMDWRVVGDFENGSGNGYENGNGAC